MFETEKEKMFDQEEKALSDSQMLAEGCSGGSDEKQCASFETLEEACEAYQKAAQKIAELEKKLALYEADFEKYEEDAIARNNGYADRLAMALEEDMRQHELNNYALAARHLLSLDRQLEVNQLITKCRVQASEEDMSKLRRYFAPEVIALSSTDLANYHTARQGEYETWRAKEKEERLQRKMEDFRLRWREWLSTPAKESLFAKALDLTNGLIDLDVFKEMIDAVILESVSKSQKEKTALLENAQTQESLWEPSASAPSAQKKKWLTREEYLKLSPKEEHAKYNQIVEQIRLEKEGVLPKMLLK